METYSELEDFLNPRKEVKMLLAEFAPKKEDYATTSNPVYTNLQWTQVIALLNKLVWNWYTENSGDPKRPLFTIKKWGFLSFTVRMKHLHDILTFIFGEPVYNESL